MSRRLGEFEIIERIKASFGKPSDSLIMGIGDDCAITSVNPGFQLLSTIDALVEDVHYRRSYISPEQLGHKAMAVNLSDIAAMGGIPRHAFISLCIPDDVDQDYLERFYRGMCVLASAHGTVVAGGNISKSIKGFNAIEL